MLHNAPRRPLTAWAEAASRFAGGRKRLLEAATTTPQKDLRRGTLPRRLGRQDSVEARAARTPHRGRPAGPARYRPVWGAGELSSQVSGWGWADGGRADEPLWASELPVGGGVFLSIRSGKSARASCVWSRARTPRTHTCARAQPYAHTYTRTHTRTHSAHARARKGEAARTHTAAQADRASRAPLDRVARVTEAVSLHGLNAPWVDRSLSTV